jgi:hypothetical protein
MWTAKERILERLQRYTAPKPPPALHPISPPVPEISPSLLSEKASTLQLLNADLSSLTEFTK